MSGLGACVATVLHADVAVSVALLRSAALGIGLGWLAMRIGLGRAERQLAALERCIAAPGELTAITVDRSEAINGRNPWLIEFAFMVSGVRRVGQVRSWAAEPAWQVGDAVRVVHLPDQPEVCSLWPPVN